MLLYTALHRFPWRGATRPPVRQTQAEEMLASLPPTLISLQLELQTPIQVLYSAAEPHSQQVQTGL